MVTAVMVVAVVVVHTWVVLGFLFSSVANSSREGILGVETVCGTPGEVPVTRVLVGVSSGVAIEGGVQGSSLEGCVTLTASFG